VLVVLILARIAPLGQVHLLAQVIPLTARVALLVPTLVEVLFAIHALLVSTVPRWGLFRA